MIEEFKKLSFQEKKENLLFLLGGGGDLFEYVSSLPNGSNGALMEIYLGLVEGAKNLHDDDKVFKRLETGEKNLLKYSGDVDKQLDEKQADTLIQKL